MAPSNSLGIRGQLIDAPEYGRLRSWRGGALIIDGGRIAEIGEYETLRRKPREQGVRWLHSNRVAVFPGLIDLHAHIPQYPAVGRSEEGLLPWLRQHIFPLEKEFTGPKARREVPGFFAELARHGTTTAMLYGAIYEDTCDTAFTAAHKLGIRAIIGKVMMDVGSYGSLQPRKVLSISLHESESLCKKWHGANDGLLEYAFSPRFAVSCSEKMMRGAAELATQYSAYLQTHLAENHEEVQKVGHLFAGSQDYTDVYDRCGMLGPRTVMAHAIHLGERERARLAETGTAVAHCPTANLFLGSGIMDLADLHGRGIPIGLGTDVAAGPELNLWKVMRSAIESQQARSYYVEGNPVPKAAGVLHLATAGAARALGKEAEIGTLEIGKQADLTLMDITALLPYRRHAQAHTDMSAEDILNLCVYRGGPEAVVETFVRGRSIYRSVEPELF